MADSQTSKGPEAGCGLKQKETQYGAWVEIGSSPAVSGARCNNRSPTTTGVGR